MGLSAPGGVLDIIIGAIEHIVAANLAGNWLCFGVDKKEGGKSMRLHSLVGF